MQRYYKSQRICLVVTELLKLTARRFNWVGVRVGVPRLLPVPVDGRALAGHDEVVLTVLSPGDGCEFCVMMK